MATKFGITDTELRSLHSTEKTYTKHYGGGFYVSVLPNGRKVCRYNYQAEGKRQRFELGEYHPNVGAAAELTAEYNRVHQNRIINGIDPVAELLEAEAQNKTQLDKRDKKKTKKAAKKLAKDNRVTVKDLAEDFKKRYTGATQAHQIAASTKRIYAWMIGKYVIPEFGHYPLEELPEDDILDFIDTMAQTRPTGANQLHAMMSAMFRWAVLQRRYNSTTMQDKYRFRRNPLAGVPRPAAKVKRDRVLDFAVDHGKFKDKGEIKKFWEWLPSINPNHANALRLVLMMGVRPSEVLGLQWEDIFSDEIVIPAVKMKSQYSFHTVPLTPQLKDLMDDICATAIKKGEKDYLFPKRPRSGGSLDEAGRSYPHLGHATLSGQVLSAIRSGALNMPKFSPHDLRRTVAFHVSNLGFAHSDVDVLLHHKETGVIAHYAYNDPLQKKLAMLAAWHNRMDELLSGKRKDNVVGIRKSS
jgi:integrase